MDNQSNLLERGLLELLDPNTTPEKALELLSSPCFSQENYRKGDNEPDVIFLAFIRFIMKRLPNGCVNGIWVDILRKTIMYSRNFSESMTEITRMKKNNVPNIYTRVVPVDDVPVSTWLNKALSSYSNCPNPYIRLEMFRLIRIFRSEYMNKYGYLVESMETKCQLWWEPLCNTFIHTISDVEPQHFYLKVGLDELLFDVHDFDHIVGVLNKTGKLPNVFEDFTRKHDYKKQFDGKESKFIKFIKHSIQLVGVFAIIASSNHDPKKRFCEIVRCFSIIKEIEEFVNNGSSLPVPDNWWYFYNVVSTPPYHHCIVETLRDLSSTIINIEDRKVRRSLIYLRDIIVGALEGFCSKSYELPRLLLSRQIQGPAAVHQHSLLVKSLDPHYKYKNRKMLEIDFEDDGDWLESFLEKHIYHLFTSSESDSDNDSSNITRSSDSSMHSDDELMQG